MADYSIVPKKLAKASGGKGVALYKQQIGKHILSHRGEVTNDENKT
jgi:hypothetical protein